MAKYRHFREVSAIVHHFRVTIEKQEEKSIFISISILLFSSIGMISAGRMHLYLALLFHRDYFAQLNASLSDSFAPQGLFRPAECISVGLFCAAGIISAVRMHPITGGPSLKTSLPGHSVNFRFAEHHPLSFQGAHPWLG